MARRALGHTGHDGVLEAQKVVGRGQQLQRFGVQKLLLVVRELEIVNEHRLVGQKGDEPDDLVQPLVEILFPLEQLVAEVLETAVTLAYFFGCPGGQ